MAKMKLDSTTLLDMLRSIKPVASPCSITVRDWWDKVALPTLRDQALSELRRNDEFPPRLIGFMKGGDMGVIDVSSAMAGTWGSRQSKDATAFIHKIAAMVPGTYASVFCVEAWALHANSEGELDRQSAKYPSLRDHPDRYETMMFNMLHYEHETNQMMQLSTMIEVLKVLGANRDQESWQGTKLSDEVQTTDPLDRTGDKGMTGRFIFGDPENPS